MDTAHPDFDFDVSSLTETEIAHLVAVNMTKLRYLQSYARIALEDGAMCNACLAIVRKLGL